MTTPLFSRKPYDYAVTCGPEVEPNQTRMPLRCLIADDAPSLSLPKGRIGHSQISFTLNAHDYLPWSMDREGADELDALLL